MVIKNTTKTKQTKRATVPQSHIWTGAILTGIKMLGLSFTPIFKHTTSTLHFVLLTNLFSFLCPLVEILRFVYIAYEKKKKANVAWPSLCSAHYHDWEQINTLRDGFAQSFLLNALVCNETLLDPFEVFEVYYIRERHRLKWVNSSVTRKIDKNHCYYYLYLHDIKIYPMSNHQFIYIYINFH
jgi:hypothetical protein